MGGWLTHKCGCLEIVFSLHLPIRVQIMLQNWKMGTKKIKEIFKVTWISRWPKYSLISPATGHWITSFPNKCSNSPALFTRAKLGKWQSMWLDKLLLFCPYHSDTYRQAFNTCFAFDHPGDGFYLLQELK